MEPKYIVIEMQNGIIGGNTWAHDDRASAEVKYYQVLSEVVKSPVGVHTVMLVTDEGFVIDTKCYKHAEESGTVEEAEQTEDSEVA